MQGLKDSDDQDKLVIPALRELACVLLLARFHVHTENTLALLENHISRFGAFAKVSSLA
jgi:hypothetical protein